jgi:hypothetical protein
MFYAKEAKIEVSEDGKTFKLLKKLTWATEDLEIHVPVGFVGEVTPLIDSEAAQRIGVILEFLRQDPKAGKTEILDIVKEAADMVVDVDVDEVGKYIKKVKEWTCERLRKD